jgi:hypothetical protein
MDFNLVQRGRSLAGATRAVELHGRARVFQAATTTDGATALLSGDTSAFHDSSKGKHLREYKAHGPKREWCL